MRIDKKPFKSMCIFIVGRIMSITKVKIIIKKTRRLVRVEMRN